MRERTGRARAFGVLSAGLLAALLASPALAQTDDVPPPSSAPDTTQPDTTEPPPPEEPPPPGSWEASSFDAPFDVPDAVLTEATFDVSGTLRYQRTGAEYIRDVEVRVIDDPGDTFAPADGCPLPEPVASTQAGPSPDTIAAEHPFLVEDVVLPCNGRYLVEAEGRLDDPEAPSPEYTLSQSFLVEVPPVSVTGLGVTVDSQSRAVTVSFQPLAETDLAFDALGYVLERSGPGDEVFVDLESIEVGEEPTFVDPLRDAPAGAYTYRVRAVRRGAGDEVRSSVTDTETDTVEVTGEPESSGRAIVGKGRRSTGPRSTGRRQATAATAGRSVTSTTVDTGFEDTLDYGASGSEGAFGGPTAGGQSIVQDEAEGMGLAVPAAGALVMLGWAGHILYLNRLAKQL